ncbi:hypothetical protein BU23DRAFT_156628 [Bimuria novae-zelandiae CBS 107.79]|uniref:Uncharacterized protein n=1 Tax=Bimuria novae-zelandiae CBS 107.79 TaxID=1447943 RepID=A0A6A5VHB9_9PLEO|nr:hypothetical protein BU23DRAFT_156628 [Bimuria novae-zelandiae CBS 107.79]
MLRVCGCEVPLRKARCVNSRQAATGDDVWDAKGLKPTCPLDRYTTQVGRCCPLGTRRLKLDLRELDGAKGIMRGTIATVGTQPRVPSTCGLMDGQERRSWQRLVVDLFSGRWAMCTTGRMAVPMRTFCHGLRKHAGKCCTMYLDASYVIGAERTRKGLLMTVDMRWVDCNDCVFPRHLACSMWVLVWH